MSQNTIAQDSSAQGFAAQSLTSWSAPRAEERHAAIDALWAPDGRLTVSSTGQTLTGREAITAHIDGVYEDLIADKGLEFRYNQEVTSGDALLLRWSMIAPDGTVAGRGVDIVYRDDAGCIATVHMFMGIN